MEDDLASSKKLRGLTEIKDVNAHLDTGWTLLSINQVMDRYQPAPGQFVQTGHPVFIVGWTQLGPVVDPDGFGANANRDEPF